MYFLSLICNYSGSDAFHAYTRHEWFFPRKFSLVSFMIATARFAIPQTIVSDNGKTTPPAQNVLKSKVFYFIFQVLFRLHVLTGRLKEQLSEKGETEQWSENFPFSLTYTTKWHLQITIAISKAQNTHTYVLRLFDSFVPNPWQTVTMSFENFVSADIFYCHIV